MKKLLRNRSAWSTGLLAFLLAVVAAPALDTDETVLEADVPAEVKAAVAKKYPGSVTGLWGVAREGGGKIVMYETKAVTTTKNATGAETKREVMLHLSPAGKIVEERETIATDQVPEAVKKGLAASHFNKGTIKKVTRTVTDEKMDQAEYGIDVALDEWQGEKGDFLFGIRFDSTGRQLED